MALRILTFTLFLQLSLISNSFHAQCAFWDGFELRTDTFTNPAFGNMVSLEEDKTGKSFLYLAAKDAGIKIYDISEAGRPVFVGAIDTSELEGLDAINLLQQGIHLYVTLGDIWSNEEKSGLAIVDVSDPENAFVTDVYSFPDQTGGAGCVVVREPFAYLAAMRNGLIILNVSDKSDIQFKSRLTFENNFPHTMIGGDGLYNARGIDLLDNIAYICYDRGALRVVNIADEEHPVEINKYCFAPLINKATAYNNIFIHDTLAFVALDYYGMEILDISDPLDIQQLGWWHPETWADTTNEYSVWANSRGHANELSYDPECQRVYVAAGKSDVVAIDVSNPYDPVTCGLYGSDMDNYGTWGLDYFNDRVYAAYIWTFIFPPFSHYTGFAELIVNKCISSSDNENFQGNTVTVSPNPFFDQFQIEFADGVTRAEIMVMDMYGHMLYKETINHTASCTIHLKAVPGIYFLQVRTANELKLIKLLNP